LIRLSTIDERRERASAGVALNHDPDGWYGDFARPRVFLQPIAAPSILGLFGFAAATFMVAANLAGWYGNASTPAYLAPFALTFGGIAQFLAGMWSYRARDGVATAMHGMWGSFWIGYGILQVLLATHVLHTGGTLDSALAFWFFALAALTFSGAVGGLLEGNGGLFGRLCSRGVRVPLLEHDRAALGRLDLRHLGRVRVVCRDGDDVARLGGQDDPPRVQDEQGSEQAGRRAGQADPARLGRAGG
jgi:hypothetical protein